MGLRGDAIVQFDWSVGEIVNALKEYGLLDNTLIILTSDNGPVLDDGYADNAEELAGGHEPAGGSRGGKYSAFEGGTRVPFIVHWPARIKRPAVKNALVSQIDFLEAMAEIVGLPDASSLSPDGNASEYRVWLGEIPQNRSFAVGMAANHTLSLIDGEWKYIEPKGGPAIVPWGPKIETGYSAEPQLYRRVNGEFDETVNVADETPEMVEYMKRTLEAIKKNKGLWIETGYIY